jgi:hypothetical protein
MASNHWGLALEDLVPCNAAQDFTSLAAVVITAVSQYCTRLQYDSQDALFLTSTSTVTTCQNIHTQHPRECSLGNGVHALSDSTLHKDMPSY